MSEDPSTPEREQTEVVGPPRLLAGKYRLGKLLGEGGMGAVYAAEHTGLGATVAVKLLNESCVTDKASLARFRREARAMGAVRHDNVVAVMDTGTDDDGVPFIVMEYLQGESLGAMLRRDRVMSPAFAYRVGVQILSGLAAAHDKNIIHRDLKPGNVFMARQADGGLRPKILDFGVSKLADSSATLNVTADGVAIGTPAFMAPEQIRGWTDLDARVDIYAVGVLLYRMMTGKLPFKAPTIEELNRKVLRGEITRPRQIRPEIPGPLEKVLLKATAVDREQRYRTAEEFRAALQQSMASMFGDDRFISSGIDMSAEPGDDEPDTGAPTIAASPEALRANDVITGYRPLDAPRGRGKVLAIAVVSIALMAAGGFFGYRAMTDSGPSGPTLRVGVTRFLPTDQVEQRFAGLVEYLAGQLDRPVELVVAADADELTTLVDDGHVDVAALSPYPYVLAKRKLPGLQLIATPVTTSGTGYSGSILVRSDSSIESVTDLRGKPFCYVREGSTSGWLMPRRALRAAGLDPDADLSGIHYGQNHLATLKLLDKGTCEAAAVFNKIWHDADDFRMSSDSFRPIASYTMPHDAYVASATMPAEEVEAIRAAFLALNAESALAARVLADHHDALGFAEASDADYGDIRRAVEEEPALRR